MSKAALADSLDALQTHLDPLLGQTGFRKHGRTYNRITTDGLTHVIGLSTHNPVSLLCAATVISSP
jgi:hypothetical protein